MVLIKPEEFILGSSQSVFMLLLYINIQYDIDDVFVSDFLKMYMLYNKTVAALSEPLNQKVRCHFEILIVTTFWGNYWLLGEWLHVGDS